MKTLKEEGVLENTLVVFSSDNGHVLNDGYYDGAIEKLGDHTPAGPLRGGNIVYSRRVQGSPSFWPKYPSLHPGSGISTN